MDVGAFVLVLLYRVTHPVTINIPKSSPITFINGVRTKSQGLSASEKSARARASAQSESGHKETEGECEQTARRQYNSNKTHIYWWSGKVCKPLCVRVRTLFTSRHTCTFGATCAGVDIDSAIKMIIGYLSPNRISNSWPDAKEMCLCLFVTDHAKSAARLRMRIAFDIVLHRSHFIERILLRPSKQIRKASPTKNDVVFCQSHHQ